MTTTHPTPDATDAARDELVAAFRAAFVGSPDVEARLGFLAPHAVVVVHDVPFPLDREAYGEHLRFHEAGWESLAWVPLRVSATVHGSTGVAHALFNERGKPRDAGYRQRPGFASAYCARVDGRWTALGLHLSPLRSQVLQASPS